MDEASVPSVGQRQAQLIELRRHLFEALLTEVRDVQEIVGGALNQLTDRLHLGTTEAVAGTLRQVECFDRQIEIGRARALRLDLAELEITGAGWTGLFTSNGLELTIGVL